MMKDSILSDMYPEAQRFAKETQVTLFITSPEPVSPPVTDSDANSRAIDTVQLVSLSEGSYNKPPNCSAYRRIQWATDRESSYAHQPFAIHPGGSAVSLVGVMTGVWLTDAGTLLLVFCSLFAA